MSTLIFLHIPKSAGTSLGDLYQRNFTTERLIHSYVWGHTFEKFWARTLYPMDDLPTCIFGHLPYGIDRGLRLSDVRYTTVLRDPVEWVISYYYHVLHDKLHPLHATTTRAANILEWLHADERFTDSYNAYTWYLTGEKQFADSKLRDDRRLAECATQATLYNLFYKCSFFGLQERLPETVFLTALHLRFRHVFLGHLGKSGDKRRQRLSTEQQMEIRQSFSLLEPEVFRVYKAAVDEFNARLGRLNETQQRALDTYRQLAALAKVDPQWPVGATMPQAIAHLESLAPGSLEQYGENFLGHDRDTLRDRAVELARVLQAGFGPEQFTLNACGPDAI